MAITRLSTGRVFLTNASHLYMTPYTSEDTVGTTTYDVVSIVADTVSIEPDDNETNSIDWEFGDTPLMENITLGNVNFSATCIDMQSPVLHNLFGWNQTAYGVYAPVAYSDLYCSIVVTFHDASSPKVVMPKVKINSKAVIQSLKTGTAEAQLSGTAYSAYVAGSSSVTGNYPIVNVAQFGTADPGALLALGSVYVRRDNGNEKIFTVIDDSGTIKWDTGANVPSTQAYYTNGAETYFWDSSDFSLVATGVPVTNAIETTWGFAGHNDDIYINGGNGTYVNPLA